VLFSASLFKSSSHSILSNKKLVDLLPKRWMSGKKKSERKRKVPKFLNSAVLSNIVVFYIEA